jgi:hypothetical protein
MGETVDSLKESYQKEKQSKQCESDENAKETKIEIVYRIKEYPALIREAEQNVADEITPIDSFESHVMGITPAPAYEFSSVDEGQNPGFTPLNSFESDVMGITPLDSSSSDYQI